MRIFVTFLTGLFVFMAGSYVYAADEFGARFGNDAPTALGEKAPEPESDPQNIEPAAGEEESTEEPAAPAASGDAPVDPEAEADAEIQ